jgi:NADPH:quinone reductase
LRALVLERPAPVEQLPNVMHIREMPAPQPPPGCIRVQVHAAGLNPVDYQLATYGNRSWQYPHILGLDVAGTVDALGEGVSGWSIGDRVYYHGDLRKPGGFAEYAVNVAHTVAPIPERLSFVEAAALPCAGFTAYLALHRRLHVHQGQTALIQGGAGGVGGFGVQLAKLAGARVLATCSARNANYVRGLGADETIDYHNENVPERARALTSGRGVDIVLDCVGSETAAEGLEALAFGGGIACVAGLPDLQGFAGFDRALSLHDISLGGAYIAGDRVAQDDMGRIAREFAALSDRINPTVTETIRLDDIPHALQRLAGRHVHGKIVALLA